MVLGNFYLRGFRRARAAWIEDNSTSGAIMGKVAQLWGKWRNNLKSGLIIGNPAQLIKKWLNYLESGAININKFIYLQSDIIFG
jgi:hypothetical protein